MSDASVSSEQSSASADEAGEQPSPEGALPDGAFEPAPAWMVTTVYVLLFLFVQGTVYRIIWPDESSLLHYGVYFLVTAAPTIVLVRWRRKRRADEEPAVPSEDL